jgi:hypothetical protein
VFEENDFIKRSIESFAFTAELERTTLTPLRQFKAEGLRGYRESAFPIF